jgi:hypothetical protein
LRTQFRPVEFCGRCPRCDGGFALERGYRLRGGQGAASNGARPVWEKRVVTIGFHGTYNDETIESFGTSLVGKQSIRFNAKMRILIPD